MHARTEFQSLAVARFLGSGQVDADYLDWPGQNFLEASTHADRILRNALVAEVLRRAPANARGLVVPHGDHIATTRNTVAPMVNGLFSTQERSVVLNTLGQSVVFLSPDSIETVLRQQSFLSTAWTLANMYLLEQGALLLSAEAPQVVGMSEGTTCYLSLSYFERLQTEPFSDYLVHEAAHVFHNCKRSTVGLSEARNQAFLLNIDYRKRETFAYACEAYSRIVALARSTQGRKKALIEHVNGPLPNDESVDLDEYLKILSAAIEPGNGWKRILNACAPSG